MNKVKFSTKNLRHGVVQCLDESVQMMSDSRRARLFQAHTRWGKSLAIRLIAYCMNYGYIDPETGEIVEPCSSVHVLVTPSKQLVNQMLDEMKWQNNLKKFDMEVPPMGRCSIGSVTNHTQINPNAERFLAITIQQLSELDKRGILLEWIQHIHYVYGFSMVFHFDEVHFNNEDKPWGELELKIQSYGATIIGWTATPQRADNGLLPGAKVKVRGQTDGTETVVKGFYTDADGKRWVKLEDRQVSITDLIVVPDVSITFSTGWNLGYILRVDHDFIDPKLAELNIDGSEESAILLSQLSSTFVRKNSILRQVVEHPFFIRLVVKSVLRHLPSYRSVHPRARVLIFSNADNATTKGTDDHARIIKKIFQQEAPFLKVEIDTGNAERPGAAMAQFEAGACDVLIVKRMGAVGWDVPDIMIVADLSVDRTAARCMQAWLRGATFPEGIAFRKFTLILPQDQIAIEIFLAEIDRAGGVARLKDVSVIGEREKELEPKERPLFDVADVGHGDFWDSDLNFELRSKLRTVNWFLGEFPEVSTLYSQAQIAGKLGDRFADEGEDSTEPDSGRTDEQITDLQMRVTANIDEYARLTGIYNRERQAEWAKHKESCWHTLRMRCGGYECFPKDGKGRVVEISKLRDLDLLRTMARESLLMRTEARRGQQQSAS